jgi:hypothetical protein
MAIKWDDLFLYDESSVTCLRWKVSIVSGRNGNQTNTFVGSVAGTIPVDNKYHSIVSVDSQGFLVHRVVWEMFNGEIDNDDIIDHEDGDGRNNKISNLRRVSQTVNLRNCKLRVDNKTGVCGVFQYTSRHGTPYISALWRTLDGKSKSKSFSTTKYGNEEAFRMACEYRAKMIAELNAQGAGYTDDHGKR